MDLGCNSVNHRYDFMEKKSHFWQQMSEYLPVTLLLVVAYGEAINFFHMSPVNMYLVLKKSTSRSCRSASASTPTDLTEPFSINTQNSCTGVPLPYCLQSQSSCYWPLTVIALLLYPTFTLCKRRQDSSSFKSEMTKFLLIW